MSGRAGLGGVHRRGGRAEAVEGLVIVDGPDNVALTLTPAAAVAMSRRLALCASRARSQRQERPAKGGAQQPD